MSTLVLPPERRAFFVDLNGQWTIYRDKDSILDYTLDWSGIIGNDPIATSAWALDGLTTVSTSNTTTTATIKVSGSSNATARNTITTAGGRTHVRRLQFITKDL
jgi:hypothetical protein